jgi:glycosyltransferase involved in cell wall biosynthesis
MLQFHSMASSDLAFASHPSGPVAAGRKGPLVTVLVPTFNRRRSLPRALASVLRQTHRELEVFVIRDGGEEVADVVRAFHDPRLVFIDRSENRGKPSSLNEALGRARGKYVAYLDDDDVYYPGHVETLVAALEGPTDCQAAYTDLYKTYCQELPDGRQVILSKRVEISRDFDRMFMLYFNHVLHVSLMHRRDLVTRTGPYNENLNILIDWDMTRRLVFFTDFLHVPAVTGEFYSPIGECDRISVQKRKDPEEYLRNVLSIRTTRPAKPWPKIDDLSIVVLAGGDDRKVKDLLLHIWRLTFYPYRVHVAMPAAEAARFRTRVPGVTILPTADAGRSETQLDAALRQVDGSYVAVVLGDLPIKEMWVENPLYALIQRPVGRLGFLMEGSTTQAWGAVLRRSDLLKARADHPEMSLASSLAASGIEVRSPLPSELPFQLDESLRQAKLAEADGNWAAAGRSYESIVERHRNEYWMMALGAQAYFNAGKHSDAARLSGKVNRSRPTIDTLLLEAKMCRQRGDFREAIHLLVDAEQRLGEQVSEPFVAAGWRAQAEPNPALRS